MPVTISSFLSRFLMRRASGQYLVSAISPTQIWAGSVRRAAPMDENVRSPRLWEAKSNCTLGLSESIASIIEIRPAVEDLCGGVLIDETVQGFNPAGGVDVGNTCCRSLHLRLAEGRFQGQDLTVNIGRLDQMSKSTRVSLPIPARASPSTA